MRESEQSSNLSNEQRFAEILPYTYTVLKARNLHETPTNEQGWQELLATTCKAAEVRLKREQKKLFKNLRKGNHESLQLNLNKLQKSEKSLKQCFGSSFYWIDANPLSPAHTYMTDEIRNWFWSVIEKRAESHEEKVKWAIRTYQPQAIIMKLLSDPEQIQALITEMKEETSCVLHEACVYLNLPVIRLLLKHGADINISAGAAGTPLFLACQRSYYNATVLLLKHSPSFETLIKALDRAPVFLNTITQLLLNSLSKNYVNSDSAMEKEKEKIPILLVKYPSAFNTLLSSSDVYPCDSLKKVLPNLPQPTVSLLTAGHWSTNLRFFSQHVLDQNPSLKNSPCNISEAPSDLKRQRIG